MVNLLLPGHQARPSVAATWQPQLNAFSSRGYRVIAPDLFIEAGYDSVADTAVSRLRDPMREFCTNLTETSVNAGHWIALERPNKVNDTVAHWLRRALD